MAAQMKETQSLTFWKGQATKSLFNDATLRGKRPKYTSYI